ncbi:MAG: hypothetical protein Ct9H300mP18_00540 [Candidatus Neomarinimicrobiota bacterium]|nr:MAG: hypothetical protein Ct9H300mP18_00540 [Candidatus Neomarinimicrobiota bacterium]
MVAMDTFLNILLLDPYLDSRVQTIYGGTNEIMKEIIGRSLGF